MRCSKPSLHCADVTTAETQKEARTGLRTQGSLLAVLGLGPKIPVSQSSWVGAKSSASFTGLASSPPCSGGLTVPVSSISS